LADKRPAPPSHYAIVEEWKKWLLSEFRDIDKPECFACGKPARSTTKTLDPKKLWNTCNLEKAHIVPFSLKGGNEPDNFFLLCSACHKLAPTTIFKEDLLTWASNQSEVKRKFERLMEEMKVFLPDDKERDEFANWYVTLSDEEIHQLLRSRKNEFSTHSTTLPASTMVAMLVRIWKAQR
jgi:hypothetical protein